MRALLPLVLLATFGCGSDLLGPDFAEELVHFGGCVDVIFYAVDSDDEVMVTFLAEGLVAEARAAGREISTVVELPTDDVELTVEQGSQISDATCDDVIEAPGPRVRHTWTAISGTATVRIRPPLESSGAQGDLVLEDVGFASGDEQPIKLERLEWQNVFVGWFPG